MADWWKNQWLVAAVIIVIVLLLLQTEFDVFNAIIRGIVNLVLYSFYAPIVLVVAIILIVWYYAKAKKSTGEKH